MKYAVMQPYFIPYLGYWQMMAEVDVFVVYDDVQFVKRSWITRNRVVVGNEPSWISLPVKKASQHKKINEVVLSAELLPKFWTKTQRTVSHSYAKADEFDELIRWIGVLERLSFKYSNLSDFLYNQLVWISNELELGTKLIRSSEMSVPSEKSRADRLMAYGRMLGANSYVNAPGGAELYKEEEFAKHGFELTFYQPRLRCYHEGKVGFVPGLSILDCVAHVSKRELQNYMVKVS